METTYDRLRNLIVSGDLGPGRHLVETSLAESLGVSRTPIREALSRLEQDGLVERGSRGLQVRQRSPAEILEIYEVRIVLEATAARAAAERYTQVDKIKMQASLNKMESHQGDEARALATANREFHRSIWHASHNRTMVDMLERISIHLFRYPFTTYEVPGRAATSLEEHREMAEAILVRDGEAASRLASHHMTVARNLRLEMWERDPSLLSDQ